MLGASVVAVVVGTMVKKAARMMECLAPVMADRTAKVTATMKAAAAAMRAVMMRALASAALVVLT